MGRSSVDRKAQREQRLERAKARRERVAGTMRGRPADGETSRPAPGLWRYRDKLTPLYVAGGAWAAGTVLHVHHVPPLAAAGATAVASAGAWWTLPKATALRGVELRYATAVAAGTGLWVTMADAAGPGQVFYPWAAFTLGLGAPWWKHRRVRRRVQVDKTISAWESIAEMAGIDGLKVHAASVVADAHGWVGNYTVEPPMTARGAKEYEPQLAAAIAKVVRKNLAEDAVTLEPTGVRGGRIHVLESDPHADPQVWDPASAPASITEPFDLGLYSDGQPMMFALWVKGDGMQQVLVSGVKGSGKTGLELLMAKVFAGCEDARVIYCDLKGGQDSRPIAGQVDRHETTPLGAMEALRWLKDEVDRRGQACQDRIWKPTADEPAIVYICDELAELPEDAWELLDSVDRRGRSVGVSVVLATQYPTTDVVPSQSGAQLDTRFTFRLAKPAHRKVAMLQYDDRDPSLFPMDRPGTCFFEGRGARNLSLRVRFVTDEQLGEDHAARSDGDPIEPAAPRKRGEWPPTTDPDNLPPVAPVEMRTLRVDRPDLDEPTLSDDAAEEAFWRSLRAGDCSPKALKTATGRKNTWVHTRLDAGVKSGEIERLGRGLYRARARELTTT